MDVYAKAGIPMKTPPDQEDENKFPSESPESPSIAKWRQDEADARNRELRLECLKLAVASDDPRAVLGTSTYLERAENFLLYVRDGLG